MLPRRIIFAVLVFTTAFALSGCPFFTRDEAGVDPVAPAEEAPAEEGAAEGEP